MHGNQQQKKSAKKEKEEILRGVEPNIKEQLRNIK